VAQIIKEIKMNGNHTVAFGSEKLPLRISKIELPCFILSGRQHIITKSGLQKALGYDGKSETWLIDFLKDIHKFNPLTIELLNSIENPILFEMKRRDGLNYTIEGIDSIAFLDACKAISIAKKDGYLNVSQLRFAKSVDTILATANESNINNLIDTATGFEFFKEKAKDQLQRFLVQNTADTSFQWVKTFPDEFFEILFGMQDSDWLSSNQMPQGIGKTIYEIVFSRIPNDLLEELRVSKPKRTYKRKGDQLQDTQHPKLKEYTISILSLLKASGYNWNIFQQLLNRAHPKNSSFTTKFPQFPEESGKPNELSTFNQTLLKIT